MTHLNSNLHVSASSVFHSEVLVLLSYSLEALFTCSGPHKSNLFSFFCCGVPLFQPFWLSYSAPGLSPRSTFLFQNSQPSSSSCCTGSFCSSLSLRVPFTLIFLYHLKVQLPAPCLGSLSILTWLFLPEGIPVTTVNFMLQINSLLSPISSSWS